MADGLAGKLALALKACSISRARLAAEMAVDKSVVSRWVSGANAPSEHNLSTLTRLVSERVPGFSMLDWELPADRFARAFERLVSRARAAATRIGELGVSARELAEWLPPGLIEEMRATIATRGHAYEGLWRSTRLANDLPAASCTTRSSSAARQAAGCSSGSALSTCGSRAGPFRSRPSCSPSLSTPLRAWCCSPSSTR